MVTKVVTHAWEADLFNYSDFYGLFDDTVLLGVQSSIHKTQVRTYGGDDKVTVTVHPTVNKQGYEFYLGIGNDTLLASNAEDKYYDEGGNDKVNMKGGNDTVYIGYGDDTYDGGTGSDWIQIGVETGPTGEISWIDQGVSLNLNLTGPQDLGVYGHDSFVNFENIHGFTGNDTFHGTDARNIMNGNTGEDYISGRGGDDLIFGGAGNDTLIGGLGADEINLGGWFDDDQRDGFRDTVRYTTISDSKLDGYDVVKGFESWLIGGNDTIDLSALDANTSAIGNQSFTFRGTNAFSSSGGELRYFIMGSSTFLLIDNDADADAEMMIQLTDTNGLTEADFFL